MNSLKLVFTLVFLFLATTFFAQRQTAIGTMWIELLPHDFKSMEYDEFVMLFTELASKDENIRFKEDEFLCGERRIHCIRFIGKKLAETMLISFEGGEPHWRGISIKLQNTRDIRRFDPNFRFFFIGKNSTTGKAKMGKVRSKMKWAHYFALIVQQFHLEYSGSVNTNFSVSDDYIGRVCPSTRMVLKPSSLEVVIVSDFEDFDTQKKRNHISIIIYSQ